MKYFKINLEKDKPGSPLKYPDKYQEEIGDFATDHLYYNDDKGVPMLLLCIEDDNANNIVRDRVEEVTETEAKAISEAIEVRREKVIDEAKVKRLEIKAAANIPLTQEEIDALDITKPNSIFGKLEILADRIEPLKEKEALKKVK